MPGQAAGELRGRVGGTARSEDQVVRSEHGSDYVWLVRTERRAAFARRNDLYLRLERGESLAEKLGQAAGYPRGVRLEAGRRFQHADADRWRHAGQHRRMDAAGIRRGLARSKQDDWPRHMHRTVMRRERRPVPGRLRRRVLGHHATLAGLTGRGASSDAAR